MAMVVREAQPDFAKWDVKLLATDIDSKVVQTAASGVYGVDRLKGVEGQRLARWFERDEQGQHCSVNDELKSLIAFKQLNLLHAWPFKGPFDVIFCRNVTIYFDKDTQRKLFERMADMQEAGGWLFIGHSENLFNVTPRYKLAGRTVYRRVD
jgi:chemotaxis protein methyltransferase CheR